MRNTCQEHISGVWNHYIFVSLVFLSLRQKGSRKLSAGAIIRNRPGNSWAVSLLQCDIPVSRMNEKHLSRGSLEKVSLEASFCSWRASCQPDRRDELEDRCSPPSHKFSSVWGKEDAISTDMEEAFFKLYDVSWVTVSLKILEILVKPVILNTLFHQIFKKIICASVDKITPEVASSPCHAISPKERENWSSGL